MYVYRKGTLAISDMNIPGKCNVILTGATTTATIVVKVVELCRRISALPGLTHINLLFRFCCLRYVTYAPLSLGKVPLIYNKLRLYVVRHIRGGWFFVRVKSIPTHRIGICT